MSFVELQNKGLELSLSSTHLPGMYRALGFIPQHPIPREKKLYIKQGWAKTWPGNKATENNSSVRSQSWVMNLYLWSRGYWDSAFTKDCFSINRKEETATNYNLSSKFSTFEKLQIKVVGKAGEQENQVCGRPALGKDKPHLSRWRPVIKGWKGKLNYKHPNYTKNSTDLTTAAHQKSIPFLKDETWEQFINHLSSCHTFVCPWKFVGVKVPPVCSQSICS